jgi:two-component system, OmpR family, KDP operon response regulator KdpE
LSEHPPMVLVIEDDPQMLRFLRTLLRSHGYQLHIETTGKEGLAAAAQHNPDVILLDLSLPDLDGLTVTRQLRAWSAIPLVVISARDGEADKVEALDLGADDYLTKPFSSGELLARLRVALRHAAQRASGRLDPTFESGELRVDFARRQVSVRGAAVKLTPIEYRLLTALVRHAGRVITHGQILREVWGPGSVEHTHYVRVYMGQLRRKLERDPARPQLLLTEPGVGYRVRVNENDR